MTHKLNKAVLLLTTIVTASLFNSCDDDQISKESDNLYMVTTYNIANNYFKPKKANLFAYRGRIIGDWYSNEKAPYSIIYSDVYNGKLEDYQTSDYAEEFAEHYFFVDDATCHKYIDLKNKSNGKNILIDENDLISPYKEYAAYYGDTTHLKNHDSELLGLCKYYNLCVLSLTAIDVVCNKAFDNNHPAGTSLNDILYYDQGLEVYKYLQNQQYRGEELYSTSGSIQDFNPRKLNSLSENPVYLMESDFDLLFDHEPTTPGTYELTIKFTFGADPLTGETVDIEPVTVSIDF